MVSRSPTAAWHARMLQHDASPALCVAHGEPVRVFTATSLAEVKPTLAAVQAMALAGHVLVGGLSYEAAPAFDSALQAKPPGPLPLAHFHAYTESQIQTVPFTALEHLPESTQHSPWLDEHTLTDFLAVMQMLKQAILEGEFYQLNFTTRLRAACPDVSPWQLFQHLFLAQPAPESLFLCAGGFDVLSLSPELFFSWNGREIRTSPMKGTRKTMGSAFEPSLGRLSDSDKDRAENVMIVDLLRNDLAKVCEPRSVQVQSLFDVMTLPTVEQMTSTISGQTRSGTGLCTVFEALFPCGSVTGAPKAQAMQRIAQWESSPRQFYCGALGVLQGQHAHFNVPIRTVVLDRKLPESAQMEYGVGSGVTWYSDTLAEKREWWQKTEFLTRSTSGFDILETVLLEDGSWQYQNLHVQRMACAAQYFSFAWNELDVVAQLAHCAASAGPGRHLGRWLLKPDGRLVIELHAAPQPLRQVKIRLASKPMQVADPSFVRFKTTHRPHYDAFAKEAEGAFDVLLYDQDGTITETCRCNVVVQFGDCFYTPTLNDKHQGNLLAGVYRSTLLSNNTIREQAITIDALRSAKAVWLINSLRGWLPVTEILMPEQTLYFPELPAPI